MIFDILISRLHKFIHLKHFMMQPQKQMLCWNRIWVIQSSTFIAVRNVLIYKILDPQMYKDRNTLFFYNKALKWKPLILWIKIYVNSP